VNKPLDPLWDVSPTSPVRTGLLVARSAPARGPFPLREAQNAFYAAALYFAGIHAIILKVLEQRGVC
jgi:hypothetical protein